MLKCNKTVLISEKDRLFEIEIDQICIYLLFYEAYKYHIFFSIKGIIFNIDKAIVSVKKTA